MFDRKGKHTSAIVYADLVDQASILQMTNCSPPKNRWI